MCITDITFVLKLKRSWLEVLIYLNKEVGGSDLFSRYVSILLENMET
jgi:hypothetical protein